MQLAFEKASKAMGYGGLCRGICTRDLPVFQKRGSATPTARRQSKKGRAAATRPHGEANGAMQRLGRGCGAIGRVKMLVESRERSLEEGMALCSQPVPATSMGTRLRSWRKNIFH